jgi:ubiquinone/menaquinone biosynthesis C-methylase UbiE
MWATSGQPIARSAMGDIDLSRLAAAYDFRSDTGLGQRIQLMLETAGIGAGATVVDIGGGRGAQAAACRAAGARAIVADPSAAMIRHAVTRGDGVEGVLARGESLPFAAGTADLTFFHLSIHHGDWGRMLDEAYRITRPEGQVWVWTTSDAHHRSSFLARWFPSVGEIDEQRFPRIGDLEEHLLDLGRLGTTVGHRDVLRRTASQWVAAVRAGFVSTLHLLDDGEIEAGLSAFLIAHPDPEAEVEYAIEYAGVWCSRPPLQS